MKDYPVDVADVAHGSDSIERVTVDVSEDFIRDVLVRLSKQRVAGVLRPGNVWVVELAVIPEDDERTEAALKTCEMRGWIASMADAVPTTTLGHDGRLPERWDHEPLYRLTEAGWNAIHGTHEMTRLVLIVATWTLITTVVAVILAAVSLAVP